MNINIRMINENEYKVLDDFLYEAIFIPEERLVAYMRKLNVEVSKVYDVITEDKSDK